MMFDSNYDLKDESETLRFAESMSSHLRPGMNLYLKGELGAGKTTFVRGLHSRYLFPALFCILLLLLLK